MWNYGFNDSITNNSYICYNSTLVIQGIVIQWIVNSNRNHLAPQTILHVWFGR